MSPKTIMLAHDNLINVGGAGGGGGWVESKCFGLKVRRPQPLRHVAPRRYGEILTCVPFESHLQRTRFMALKTQKSSKRRRRLGFAGFAIERVNEVYRLEEHIPWCNVTKMSKVQPRSMVENATCRSITLKGRKNTEPYTGFDSRYQVAGYGFMKLLLSLGGFRVWV